MTTACKTSYTPAEMIAILSIAFVDGNLPPSINAKGEPVYRLVDDNGCAVMTIAQVVMPDLARTLATLGRHADCGVDDARLRGPLASILEVPSGWYSRSIPRDWAATQFFWQLQQCHDVAAVWYHHAVTHGVPGDMALPAFRRYVASRLVRTAIAYGIPQSEVDEAKARLTGAVAKAIPAAAARTKKRGRVLAHQPS